MVYETHTEGSGAVARNILGAYAATLAVNEAKQTGIGDPVALRMIGIKAGWEALSAVGLDMPHSVRAELNAYYDQLATPIVEA